MEAVCTALAWSEDASGTRGGPWVLPTLMGADGEELLAVVQGLPKHGWPWRRLWRVLGGSVESLGGS